MSRIKSLFLIALIILLLIALIPPVTQRLRAVAFMFNMLIPVDLGRPLDLFGRQFTVDDHQVASLSGEDITIRVYSPTSENNNQGVVLYTPLVGGGLEDLRIQNISKAFVRSGFAVAVPWSKKDEPHLNAHDMDDVLTGIKFMKDELKINDIGIFGMSYGVGPAIVAASDEEVKNNIRFIISLNGPFDITNVTEFFLTGRYSYQNVEEEIEPHGYALEVFENTLAHHNADKDTFLDTEEFDELKRNISPSEVIGGISADFFIIHSLDDNFIPYTESMRLNDSLKDAGINTFLLLTDVLEHGAYRDPTPGNIINKYIPAIRDFYDIVWQFKSRHM